jgi:hypothetical protein
MMLWPLVYSVFLVWGLPMVLCNTIDATGDCYQVVDLTLSGHIMTIGKLIDECSPIKLYQGCCLHACADLLIHFLLSSS